MYREADNEVIPAAEWVGVLLPLLRAGHQLKISPAGSSMRPFIAGGRDEVLLVSREGVKLKRGDVVLYAQEDGTHVLHRIHHVKNHQYYMLGDFQTRVEGPIKEQDVVALARGFVRKGRYITSHNWFYRTITGLWLTLRPLRPFLWRIYSRLRHG